MIRVLIADDQTLVREGIRGLLELSGEIRVVGEAKDGDEALTTIKQVQPDVALLDVRMPRASGIEVVRSLRAFGDQTRVILLSTFDDDAALLEGFRAGASGYLLKDVGVTQLCAALAIVAAGGTLFLPAVTKRAEEYVKEQGIDFEASEAPDRLTQREVEVLRLIAAGYSNREIAGLHGTAEGTVKNQTSSILSKLGVRDRTRAVLRALEMGWLVKPR